MSRESKVLSPVRFLNPRRREGIHKYQVTMALESAAKAVWSRIGDTWCRVLHDQPTWPIHGYYGCRICSRKRRIPWSPANMQSGAALFLLALLSLAPGLMGAPGETVESQTMTVDSLGQSQALSRYLSRAENGDPWSRPNAVLLEIDACLPKLAEQGHFQAVRDWVQKSPEQEGPEYQGMHIDGDATVKQQVIARYLTAEQSAAAMPASSLAVTPANYKFRYAGSSGGRPFYVFHITPRKKRPGLIEGELWIDGATGIAVHESGYLVKKPSVFIRKLKIIRDVSLRDGAPYLRTTQVEIDVRVIGRAEMTILERPCAQQPAIVAVQGSGSNENRCFPGQ
jgi:hypothetical protein